MHIGCTAAQSYLAAIAGRYEIATHSASAFCSAAASRPYTRTMQPRMTAPRKKDKGIDEKCVAILLSLSASGSNATRDSAVSSWEGAHVPKLSLPRARSLAVTASNIMFNKRVVRGSTHSVLPLRKSAQADHLESQRRSEARRSSKRPRPRPSTPNKAVDGRHHLDVQTEHHLEELNDRPLEAEAEAQTEGLMTDHHPPFFVSMQTGVDAETQIEEGDLFDFDGEVEPILASLIGETLEKAIVEVTDEVERTSLRTQNDYSARIRDAELAETQQLEAEAAEARRDEEDERRAAQELEERCVAQEFEEMRVAQELEEQRVAQELEEERVAQELEEQQSAKKLKEQRVMPELEPQRVSDDLERREEPEAERAAARILAEGFVSELRHSVAESLNATSLSLHETVTFKTSEVGDIFIPWLFDEVRAVASQGRAARKLGDEPSETASTHEY